MKKKNKFPLNITFRESIVRLALIVPAGLLGVLVAVTLHTYVLVPAPAYLLFTALTNYSPIKHVYRLMAHKPAFQHYNDMMLSSELM